MAGRRVSDRQRRWYVTYTEKDGSVSQIITLFIPMPEAAAGRLALRYASNMGMSGATLKSCARLNKEAT